MKKFWGCVVGIAALFGIVLLWGAISVMMDEHKTNQLIREADNIADPMLIYGVAVDTELGPAVVTSEGKYFFFEEGFTWKSGEVGSQVSGTGNVYWRRKYQEGSADFKKAQSGLILYQPELRLSKPE